MTVREALELLPWYVNQTLEGEEREAVRRALRSSLTCRLEYERLCRLQTLMRQDSAEHVAANRAFERLMARIESDATANRDSAAAARLRWLPVAQAAAVLALAAGIAWWWAGSPATGPGTYTTFTADEPAAAHSPQLRLVFAPEVPEETRREILAQHGLAMAAPLEADGIYRLSLPASADARAIADRLRADPRVAIVTLPPGNESP